MFPANPCPNGWEFQYGQCSKAYVEEKMWHEARNHCLSLSPPAILAAVLSPQVQTYLNCK